MTRIAEKPFEAVEKPPLDRARATDCGGEQLAPVLDAQKMFKPIIETTIRIGNPLSPIAALQANVSAKFSHLQAPIGATSSSEVVERQSAVLRKRVDMAIEQTRKLQALNQFGRRSGQKRSDR
ncbi:phasin family protein [Rhizobium mongolense]|uniref:Phasin protein n=2 Tax=Rhizobium mongolense TaxID=57676 RepID=A0ABR6IZ66_9HYPH|nr:phasin family protein [Rhizobium mongolense]MBB4233214.1 hypothetical protein [Rhizobium mongolense]TVZ75167.1 phasin protein [Rhizobium mongolense USDA 1844]